MQFGSTLALSKAGGELMRKVALLTILTTSQLFVGIAEPQTTSVSHSRYYEKKQTKKKSAARIGGAAAAGAAIGAIAGHGKGAAIGAGAGAGAGAVYDHHERSKAKEKDSYRSGYRTRDSRMQR
jgi:uncharacterized protein YcfJ